MTDSTEKDSRRDALSVSDRHSRMKTVTKIKGIMPIRVVYV